MTNIMMLKVLSILYFYLYFDFQVFDTMVCDVFPGFVNFELWSVNYLLSRCMIQEVCWSSLFCVSSLFHVYSLKVTPSLC